MSSSPTAASESLEGREIRTRTLVHGCQKLKVERTRLPSGTASDDLGSARKFTFLNIA